MGKPKIDLKKIIQLCNACNPCFIGCITKYAICTIISAICTTISDICTTIYALCTTIYWWCTATVVLIAFNIKAAIKCIHALAVCTQRIELAKQY